MKLPSGKPGISRFIFVALLLVFNWPLLSIPAPESLFGWLFTAWGLAIALLFLVAHGAGGGDAEPAKLPESGGPALNGIGSAAQGAGPGAGQSAGAGAKQSGGGDV
ncbi:MAG: hypothetical protein A2051_00145 [Desulfovibrionales bacterium GWA2_65_9]|nr:MAG: hypothetical protein A2051_00145 [Desulfovibrionales bacterium GWA2_65_9]